jgi:hypothetical protein
MVAAAFLAVSLSATPLAAQAVPATPAPDPAGDVVPGAALPPPSTSLPTGDPVPALPADTPEPDAPPAAPAVPAPSAPAPAPAPAVPAAPAPAAAPVAQNFTDADVTNFARAVIAIDPIQGDATLDETQKQAKMAQALASAGIAVDTFNAMAVQSRGDAALKTRIQTQIAALQAAQPPAG